METVKNTLNEALIILSDIPVKQNNVELMAAAKQKIRAALAELNKSGESEKKQK